MFNVFFWPLGISLIFSAFVQVASAEESCAQPAGKFVSLEGSVEVEHADQGEWLRGHLEQPLCQGDTIRVGSNSRAAVSLINDITLRIDQNSSMRLIDVVPQPEKRSLLEMVKGAFKSFSRPPRLLTVNTPYVNGMIEGTEFAMRVEGDQTSVVVYEGKVAAVNDFGRLTLARGESAVARAGSAPQQVVLVRPRDAVQWTLHYPPILSVPGVTAGALPPDMSATVIEAFQLSAKGNTAEALALLERTPEAERNAQFHSSRASLLLNIGRIGEARTEIDAALAQDPKAGLAYALRSVIEVAQNDRENAHADAQKAVELSPSAAAKIALSYAQQAEFQIEAARDTLLAATGEHPDDPLAQARLAELWLMLGERGKSLEAARKAETLAPDQARTKLVLGFAALAELRTDEARTIFERAVALDSSDPLAHMGLGLARIKDGDLPEGRRELEVAVALDSSNALLRPYLGKAYYEEKRPPHDAQQYSIAKELDPADPTAYLYDAIQKQTTNRPVEALKDMEKAIELNDNRAVYRSRLLLDSDLAARSASFARVYSDLGFQQRALVEGWNSLNADPGNFSAHRFLADTYSVLPRHEIARVSELLQSQLLQPLNMTPIQPHLAESNLFLVGSGGPGALSFNEFNPIFNRNGVTFQTTGFVGEKNTYAGEGVLSGIYDNAAFSFGGFHFTSDGFRKNDDQSDNIANAFAQVELSPQTSIQAEYRYRQTEKGDLRRLFFSDNFFPGERNEEERNTYRFGARHSFSESSTVLGTFIYQEADVALNDDQLFIPGVLSLKLTRPEKSLGFELQHLFRSQYANLVTGVGHSDVNGWIDSALRTEFPPPFDLFTNHVDLGLRHTNAYAYSYLKPWRNLTVTLGLSGDVTSGDSPDVAGKGQVNPKFGITWEPVSGTLLRAAAFRGLKRTLITNQTLEPTQVAGFNQFFDDFNGAESWRYGAGIDQKFSSTLFAGAELSRRDLHVSAIGPEGSPIVVPWHENQLRSYIFWTPVTSVALRAEYQFEQVSRGQIVTNGAEKLDSHRVPLGINYFHPLESGSGLNASLTATYVNQSGIFERVLSTGTFEPGDDDFWTIDTAISYRLPKRYGFVTLGASNLLDEDFNFYDTDFNNPRLHAGRMVFGRVTLAIP